MLNSIKQLIRTPIKAILFFLLIIASTALLMLGANLWQNTQKQIDDVEASFTTIGMVEQKPNSVRTLALWDAYFGANTFFNYEVFDSYLSADLLNFEGAQYTTAPEHRPYYDSYMPEYRVMWTENHNAAFLAEFTPYEDCVPNKPVHVQIVQVLYGDAQGSDSMWICDHYTEEPMTLEKGKHYIAYVRPFENLHTNPESATEVIAQNLVYSTQCDPQGRLLESDVNANIQNVGIDYPPAIEEVTEGFYESNRWRHWQSYLQTQERLFQSVPVLPTNNTEILPTFHAKQAAVIEGREITEEEFLQGEKVCLIAQDFAKMNHLQPGDEVKIALYRANYANLASTTYLSNSVTVGGGMVAASGDPYAVFWEDTYKIAGIYRYAQIGVSGNDSELGFNTIIVPMRSIGASDENNIQLFSAMQNGTTSFQIPNGTADVFMEAFKKAVPESEYLEITFDDNGYSQVIGGLNNMRSIAILLFAVGLFAALMIIVLLLYFFIVRQKKRTAIERSLGMSKRQCRVSLASGVIVLSVVAVVLGTIGSVFLIDKVETLDLSGQAESKFSTEYSLWAANTSTVVELEEDTETGTSQLVLNLAIPAGLILITVSLSVILVNRNLKIEPILLLSAREE